MTTTLPQPKSPSGRSPSGKPRLKDIANIANISVATASMALADHPRVNDGTKRKVREISKQIGYRTKPRPEINPPRRFGLMILGGLVQDSVNAPLMMQLAQAGYENSVRFEYAATPPELTQTELLARTLEFAQDLDAILLVGEVTTQLLEQLTTHDVTTIVLGDVLGTLSQHVNATVVTFDNMAMGYQATRHLLSQGHKNIAFACEELLPGLSHERWLKGYRLALAEAGVIPATELIHVTGNRHGGLEPAADAFAQMKQPPTAFIVPDVRLSASLIKHMTKLGCPIKNDALFFDAIADQPLPAELIGRPHFTGCINALAQEAIARLMDACKGSKTRALHIDIPFKTLNTSQTIT